MLVNQGIGEILIQEVLVIIMETDRYYSQGNGNNNGNWDIGQSTDVPDGYGFKYSLSYDSLRHPHMQIVT